jgi:hypothetical protein
MLAGAIGYACQHNSCADKHWSDVRELFEPRQKGSFSQLGAAGGADNTSSDDLCNPTSAEGGDKSALGAKERESQATQLVKLALERASLFHNGEDAYATIRVGDHVETYPLKSRAWRRCLIYLYFEREQKAPSADAVRGAIESISGFALFKSEERKVFVRVARHDNKIYLDLCNTRWQVVEIDNDGWRIIESGECPVRFRRAHGMLPLPLPERGGTVNDLREFLNIASNDDFKLLVAYLLGCYRGRGPYPILVLHGEQGACKTTAARVLRELIDPNAAAVRSEPREPRDLMIAANNGWVCAFDNLSRLSSWLSDALCRMSTGGGFSTRELYSDCDEVIFDVQRPVIFTGIEEIAARGDLLDRAMIIYLPHIEEGKRVTEETFYNQFYSTRPLLLGALFDAVSCALHNSESVKLEHLPRMADFAKWVTAAEGSLGWKSGSFVRSYTQNREAANELALEASPIATAMRALEEDYAGTATELLAKLNALVDEKTKALKTWPRAGRALSNTLRRLAPNLAAIGIETSFETPSRRTGGRRLIVVTRHPTTGIPSTPSTPGTASKQNQCSFGNDGGVDEGDSRDFAPLPIMSKNGRKSWAKDAGDGEDAKILALEDDGCEI